MEKRKYRLFGVLILVALCITQSYGGSVAKIKRIEGKVSILKKGAAKWRDARVNMPINVGDEIYSREESFAELVYSSGAIIRLDEKTKVTIDELTARGTKSSTPIGNIWANMRKLTMSKKEFELSSPTATAAIRGTVFHMNTKKDSSTDVSVYKGKVSVGPNKEKQKKKPAKPAGRHEVQGPTEIPGPYEVTLDQWRMIVAGQMISVNKEGKYSEKKFDADKAAQDDFVKKNLEMDRSFEKDLEERLKNIKKDDKE